MLISNGLARAYKGGKRQGWCEQWLNYSEGSLNFRAQKLKDAFQIYTFKGYKYVVEVVSLIFKFVNLEPNT